MAGDLLYGLNQWVVFLIAVGMFYLSAEAGFRYGRRFSAKACPGTHEHVATIEAALLGLLALLLGFAFAMAMARYDARKQVVLEEVDDLETTFLRAQLLPEKHRQVCSRLLRQYVDSRVEHYRAGANRKEIDKALKWTNELQAQLWAETVAIAREDSDEVRTGYFIESLNGLIDDHTKRITAMANHVPQVILVLLVLVATMTIAVTGYSSGLRHTRLRILRFILVLLIAATLLVIVDLDRPRRGLIKVSENGMLELQRNFDRFAEAIDRHAKQ
jgi:hypothetical protein